MTVDNRASNLHLQFRFFGKKLCRTKVHRSSTWMFWDDEFPWFVFFRCKRNSTSKLYQLDEISDDSTKDAVSTLLTRSFSYFEGITDVFFGIRISDIYRNQLIRGSLSLPSWLLNSVASFLARISVFHKTPASYATTSNTFVIPSTNGTNGTCTPRWLWCNDASELQRSGST